MKRTIGCPPARRSRSVTHGMLKPLSPISIRKCATCIARCLSELWGRRGHGVRVCDGRVDDDDDRQAHSRGRAARRLARRSSRGWHARAEHTRATGANGAESRRAKAWEGRRREARTLCAACALSARLQFPSTSRGGYDGYGGYAAVSPAVSPLPLPGALQRATLHTWRHRRRAKGASNARPALNTASDECDEPHGQRRNVPRDGRHHAAHDRLRRSPAHASPSRRETWQPSRRAVVFTRRRAAARSSGFRRCAPVCTRHATDAAPNLGVHQWSRPTHTMAARLDDDGPLDDGGRTSAAPRVHEGHPTQGSHERMRARISNI